MLANYMDTLHCEGCLKNVNHVLDGVNDAEQDAAGRAFHLNHGTLMIRRYYGDRSGCAERVAGVNATVE
jgi:hypothetical protein